MVVRWGPPGIRDSARKSNLQLVLGAGYGSGAVLLLSYCAFRLHLSLSTAGSLDLLVVVLTALRIGFWEATSSSIVAFACLDYFFAHPIFSFRVAGPQNRLALASFELTALIVSPMPIHLQSDMQEAVTHRHNAEKLYELSRSNLLIILQKSAVASSARSV